MSRSLGEVLLDLVKRDSRRVNRLTPHYEKHNEYSYIAQCHDDLWDLGFQVLKPPGFQAADLEGMTQWCKETLEPNCWHYVRGKFYFKNEQDHMLFMMRWA